MIRRVVRRALLGPDPIPQYAIVGVDGTEQRVRVELRGTHEARDVTHNNVVASLRPLRIAVALGNDERDDSRWDHRRELAFIETASGRELGLIRLKPEATKPLAENTLWIFRCTGSVNRCVSRWKALLYDQYRTWSARVRKDRYNHQMSRADLESFFVFYTYPRPVVLVTVGADEGGNIFPMDLIGPVGPPYFLLALHTTAPSVERIKRIRRVTLSYMPVELAQSVYDLGKNHRVADIDWEAVPIPLRRSPVTGSPVPAAALAVAEVAVEDAYDFGSHTLFVTRITREEQLAEGRRMCHIQGFYWDDLRRRGQGF